MTAAAAATAVSNLRESIEAGLDSLKFFTKFIEI